MAYLDALGLPVEPVHEYKVGRRCVFLPHDLIAYRDLRRDGGLGLWSWVRSWLGREGALFAWDDLGPPVAYVCRFLNNRLRGAAPREDDARDPKSKLAA
jgi:hypothetical protein